ncbi:hypothetical protein DWX43_22670 [Clostridium sp. AF19-22AC]|uniref:beta-L-arabinofuranosidase domain-containing protein n=1 Tax=Clostridia TaxID=186801 RepID=UPI000E502065|nr:MULTISPECIES: beta-L-arabinofuranosidase domain-containing protein [Clostridia]RHR22061.1 hypothetical protein DWX43_22670 [Clostridium sp. AF19-22AC]
MMTTTEKQNVIEEDIHAIYLGNLNTVEFNLDLPTKGKNGSVITWESSHEGILQPDGTVRRPAYGMGNRKIELTATFTYGEVCKTQVYDITVLEEVKKDTIQKVYPLKVRVNKGKEYMLPAYTVVDTEDGDTIVKEVQWDENRMHLFEYGGTYFFSGKVKDTKEAVTLEVQVLEESKADICNKEKKAISISDTEDAGNLILLEGSPYYEAQQNMHTYLKKQDLDQFLYSFREAAGLPVRQAKPMRGWDSPEGLLRGHTTGHFLTALALAYHSTGEECFKEKADYLVEELQKCQEAFGRLEGYQKGFLSAYSQEQFDLLEQYVTYPKIWAPYYTMHKILAGLIDSYRFTRNETALKVAEGLGDWITARLKKLHPEQLEKMWSIYIAGEFGGINESLIWLYEYTGKTEYIETARLFDNEKLLLPLENHIDALSGIHANQHIPQIIGMLKRFDATKEAPDYERAAFFWDVVTRFHSYSIGGVGEAEMFHARNRIGGLLTDSTAESCASYNMLKLTKMLYEYEPRADYMDYYERTVLNHIVPGLDKKKTGESTYFFPLKAGAKREFLFENSCCHGTGMESHSKYLDSAYFYGDETLYINQFIPSKILWDKGGYEIVQYGESNHPEKIVLEISRLSKESARPIIKRVKLRKPDWCQGEVKLKVNQEIQVAEEQEGYIVADLCFEQGTVGLELEYPCGLHIRTTPDVPELTTLFYGPYVLAAVTDELEHIHVKKGDKPLETLWKRDGEELVFHCQGYSFIPLYQIDEQSYQVYFVMEY